MFAQLLQSCNHRSEFSIKNSGGILKQYFKEQRATTSSVAFERVCVDAEIFNGGTIWQFPLTKITIEATANTANCSEDVAQVDFACR